MENPDCPGNDSVIAALNLVRTKADFKTRYLSVEEWRAVHEVQKILGHSTPLMTERYAHLQPGHLVGAVNTLDRAFEMDTCASPQTSVQTPSPTNLLKTK